MFESFVKPAGGIVIWFGGQSCHVVEKRLNAFLLTEENVEFRYDEFVVG